CVLVLTRDRTRMIEARPGDRQTIAAQRIAIGVIGICVPSVPCLKNCVLLRGVIGPRRASSNVAARGDVSGGIVSEREIGDAAEGRVLQTIEVVVIEVLGEPDVVVLTLSGVADEIEQVGLVL